MEPLLYTITMVLYLLATGTRPPRIAPLEEGKNQHEQTKPQSKSDSTICVYFIAMHKGVNWNHIICFIGAMTDTSTVGWMKLGKFSFGSKI